ncbi:MAG: tRNA-specific adenosine deaminase [Desulfobacteraceae bacterium 4572_130]|nr:MAG: tRNA-specific adenosine deaminase [Desulfobacteraceae bacterium 4572_130]
MDDQFYMNLALNEAKKADKIGEIPIGAIIVNLKGKIIGKGHNQSIIQNNPCAHAEIVALRRACKTIKNYRLPEATIYVTIEPCIMCMGAIIHARLKKVVYGSPDPKWGGAGSLYNFAHDKRLNHNLEIVSGIKNDKAKKIITNFFKNKRSKQC